MAAWMGTVRITSAASSLHGPMVRGRCWSTGCQRRAGEGGIWTPPGASADAAGNIYVSVGNGAITGGQWDHSDSVLKLSPTLHLEDAFAPTSWGDENANDQDLGSQGPVLLPNNFIFAAGKSGKAYVLRANALGGIGGQVDMQVVC